MYSAGLPAPAADLAEALVEWFRASARALPWREERTPYRVWLSEVMLQQTRVGTVVGFFERFLERFPTVFDLAGAELDEVLALWSGLGYYARGRNLHRAAKVVVERHGGRFPSTAEGLRVLPGVGAYTAAAIASLAFSERVAVVDGNVARVLARLSADETPVDSPEGKRAIAARAQSLVDAAEEAGALNEALMELGALVCTPSQPACQACPWREVCRGRAEGIAARLPNKLPKRARRRITLACAVPYDEAGYVWLERREERGLFGGLYEPPGARMRPRASVRRSVQSLLEARGIPVPPRLPKARRIERTLTHRELVFYVVPVKISRERAPGRCWVARDELGRIGLSSAARAVLDAAWPDLFDGERPEKRGG